MYSQIFDSLRRWLMSTALRAAQIRWRLSSVAPRVSLVLSKKSHVLRGRQFLWTPKGLLNFDLCGIWVNCSSAKRQACDCECLKFLLGRRRAELESPTLVFDCICTSCSHEVHRDAAESSATVRPHQVPRVTGTSLVDIQVRSQRNPHKTLLCSSTPRVLVQPGYRTRGGVGLSMRPRRSVSGDFRGAFRAFLWAFGVFLVGLFWDLLGAPRAFSRLGCRRSVLVVCLSRCALALPFRLPAVCSVCSLRRLRALCCPRSLWPLGVVLLGLCAVPFWVFGFRVFRQFSGDAGRTMKIPSSAAQIARVTATWISQSSR